MKFSLAMSSMPLLRERERTGTNDRGTERNEKTRQREEGGSVRVVGGAVMRVWGGGVGSARGRAGSSARRVARDGSARGDRGRSIVGSIAVNRDGSFPPRRPTLPRRSSRDAWGRGGGRRDRRRGRERTRGARDDAHLAELLLLHEGVHIGIGLLEGLEGLGEDGVLRGAREGGLGGGIRGRRTTVSRDERRQPRSRAGGGDVGGGPRSRRARPRRGASIEARARRRGRFARAMTHHGVLRGRVASRGARRGSARRSRSERGAQPQGPVLFGVSSSGRSEKARRAFVAVERAVRNPRRERHRAKQSE